MNIGDKVAVRNKLTKFTSYHNNNRHSVSWRPSPLNRRIESAVYLGTTMLYNGDVEWSGSDEGNTFKRTGQIAVAVVQPLGNGGRYRKPVYALPEDVEAQP